MNAFLQSLMEQRRKFLDGLDANENDINLDIFEDFYPDQAHFVFELLQNAEDTGATEAAFKLSKEGCWFEHNGARTFTESDVRAITGIHNSTKTKSSDQIGKFGVGFKSVFVYTQTPTIYAADFSFKIVKYVMPEPVADDVGIDAQTRFWLPFNNPKKTPDIAYAEIAAGFNELAETTILFLPNIESIKWQVGDTVSGEVLRIAHTPVHVEVLKQINGQTTTSAHFLKFDQAVKGLEKQRVAVAFALDFLPNVKTLSADKALSQQLRIVPVSGQVCVFFPASKESSGLRFHLHAPFVPELSRASIKDTPANNPLYDQLAALSASALHDVRDLGLLTTDFLGVLPNAQDPLGKGYGYEIIRDAITEAMKTEPLFPTHGKGHAPANRLVQAKASLKELLNEDDIKYLIEYENKQPLWAASRALQGTNVERFMTGLEIRDWDIEAFVDCLGDKATDGNWGGVDKEFMAWLGRKSVDWHQQFYSLLDRESEARDEIYRLKRCRIIRLTDSNYAIGSACHFSEERHPQTDGVRCVDSAVYTAGKSKAQQESARRFLESTGVTPVGERQLVEAELKFKYEGEKRALNEREYLADLRRFMKVLDEDASTSSTLAPFRLFMGKDNTWRKASEIYLDEPYLDTGLSEYFGLGGAYQLSPLADFYQLMKIDTAKIARFAEVLGARTKLPVFNAKCEKNPQWQYLSSVSGSRYTTPIDRDFSFGSFASMVERKSEKLSKLIWSTMCSLPNTNHGYDSTYHENLLRAVYRKNETGGAHFAHSQLVHQLRRAAWVPQRGSGFVKPADARSELLPGGFTFDAGWPWIKAIQFGVNITLESEKAQAEFSAAIERHKKEQQAAESLGFKDADTARRFSAMPPDEQERALAEFERRKRVALPDHTPGNPTRRRERIFAHSANAPLRRTEERTRSVSIGLDGVKDEAKQYLRQQYTNVDAEQICQICKDVLPFTLGDGSFYFEAVELLPELKLHYDQNYLCLCPNHAAMFKHANPSRTTLKGRLAAQAENELEIVLAQTDATLYFSKTHLADLRTIIEADQNALDRADYLLDGTTN
ncbi:sacsin N-terminal ATP-binding-like domain-containing protein [Rhizobium sp. SU303]|uniref:sacsin N-terminal ATP-binding-like domain-containing protein n=1 Tax=Rhizobium sp. SU303 TaxID=3138065 RepID=UPI001E47D409|nr:hypothetical protein [Rhizobium leguminosarum]UFW77933.1 hypothetical protein RlegSU303_22290 [Rhizobium leguminosarum bv. viciae]